MSSHQYIIEVQLFGLKRHRFFLYSADTIGCCYPCISPRIESNIVHLIVHQPSSAEQKGMSTITTVPHYADISPDPHITIGRTFNTIDVNRWDPVFGQ